MNDFFERMKNLVDKGLGASQQALVKAGNKIQELGDKGLTKIELSHLESQTQKCFTKLGLLVYDMLVCKGKSSVNAKNAEVSALLNEIERLKREMEIRSKPAVDA